jgi:hypothetical protein
VEAVSKSMEASQRSKKTMSTAQGIGLKVGAGNLVTRQGAVGMPRNALALGWIAAEGGFSPGTSWFVQGVLFSFCNDNDTRTRRFSRLP